MPSIDSSAVLLRDLLSADIEAIAEILGQTWDCGTFENEKEFSRLSECPAKSSLPWDKDAYENQAFFLYGAHF